MKLTGKEDGEYQDQPDARALEGLNASDSQKSDFGAGIKAESKHYTQGIHLPRPVNSLEEKLEDSSEGTTTHEIKLAARRISDILGAINAQPASPSIELRPQRLDELVQNPAVGGAQNDQKRRTNSRADNVSDSLKPIKPISQGSRRGSQDDGRHDDNGAMAQGEEGPHGGWTLPAGDQTPSHQVNGGDVVRVEGMAKTEAVREGGRGDQARVEAQHHGDGGPHDEVHGDEEGDDGNAVGGDAAEEFGLGGELESRHGGGEAGRAAVLPCPVLLIVSLVYLSSPQQLPASSFKREPRNQVG